MQELYPITALRIYELWLTHSAPRTTPIGGVFKYLVQKSLLPVIQVTEELSLEQASTEKGLNETLSSGPVLAFGPPIQECRFLARCKTRQAGAVIEDLKHIS